LKGKASIAPALPDEAAPTKQLEKSGSSATAHVACDRSARILESRSGPLIVAFQLDAVLFHQSVENVSILESEVARGARHASAVTIERGAQLFG
jgi:hypothetical protein